MENIRVLIVDDLPQVRKELATVLKLAANATKARIEFVGEAQDGKEAVEKTTSLHPDVVLMDLEMPVLDGFEATRKIKSFWPATRVIILSIHDEAEQQERALIAGADHFIAKGANMRTLLDAISGKYESPNSFDQYKGEKL
jgi:DNA-binding NarL/FixJ family response regulator